ncbi:MAG TPA: hypothetical protein DEA27_00995 [Candidatus Moranbacteria bacterium]|nr:hypothetical protein [Candidatus Moranbacteria bacterium]
MYNKKTDFAFTKPVFKRYLNARQLCRKNWFQEAVPVMHIHRFYQLLIHTNTISRYDTKVKYKKMK